MPIKTNSLSIPTFLLKYSKINSCVCVNNYKIYLQFSQTAHITRITVLFPGLCCKHIAFVYYISIHCSQLYLFHNVNDFSVHTDANVREY